MKAKLKSKTEKSWTNPEGQVKKFFEVEVEGQDKKYGCWQFEKIAAINIGTEFEFTEVEKNGRWSMTVGEPKTGGGGFSRVEKRSRVEIPKTSIRGKLRQGYCGCLHRTEYHNRFQRY